MSPAQIAAARGHAAFTTDLLCPYDHFTQRPLVDAFYQGMARAEREHASSEIIDVLVDIARTPVSLA